MNKTRSRGSGENHSDFLVIQGAREHNLDDLSLTLPKNSFIVVTGPSGSGKSSLVFDTLYAEGQRRYVESLSAYARQFLEMMAKPDVDSIEGLSPAISIEQKTTSKNPRSTVGTITEIYDYMRLLFARVGCAYSPETGLPILSQTVTQIVDRIVELPEKQKFLLLAPIVRGTKGEFRKELAELLQKGYNRIKIDGVFHVLEGVPTLERVKRHDIFVVVDRLVSDPQDEHYVQRLTESVRSALSLGKGLVFVELAHEDDTPQKPMIFSEKLCCPVSGFSLEEIEPRLFSFNSPFGACPACRGLGIEGGNFYTKSYHQDKWDAEDESLVGRDTCHMCSGYRLKPEALCVKIAQKHIGEVCELSLEALHGWCDDIFQHLSQAQKEIATRIVKEIQNRVGFLLEVGLDYLTLSRGSMTLSGGESQRIRLASQIGSRLTGVLYVLDEPSIGLHQRDNNRLLATLCRLRDLGNTVIVVEHDMDTILAADYVVDIGPAAGRFGGKIIAQGTPQDIMACEESLTGQYLSGKKCVEVPAVRRHFERCLRVVDASTNNLQNITVDFPVGVMCCVTGVSGCGKSSLLLDTLYKGLVALREKKPLQGCTAISGAEFFDKIVDIDQSPIGRTPRSNPATYTGVFNFIREWFAIMPLAKERGYFPGSFSFNVKGGRCEACQGEGSILVEMHFLPDVHVPCDVCRGKRYSREILDVKYKDKSIIDVLEMSIEEAFSFFEAIPSIAQRLEVLMGVGLGYLQIGQPSTTLSGGEAQRVKLAKELSRRSTGKTLYILDEPTTGLHFEDVKQLLTVLQQLVNLGNTVLVIEHNLDVIKTADWLIDIGPESGKKGGCIVGAGTPEYIASLAESHTGAFLKPLLHNHG